MQISSWLSAPGLVLTAVLGLLLAAHAPGCIPRFDHFTQGVDGSGEDARKDGTVGEGRGGDTKVDVPGPDVVFSDIVRTDLDVPDLVVPVDAHVVEVSDTDSDAALDADVADGEDGQGLPDLPTTCGDSACSGLETCMTCPQDCGECCPNGECDGDETACTCPADCGAVCGDGCCTGTENCDTCFEDCGCLEGEVCFGGVCCETACAGKECGSDGCGGECGTCQAPLLCLGDSCVGCGDGVCADEAGETQCSCSADCKSGCACCDGDSCVEVASDGHCGKEAQECAECMGQDKCVNGECVCQAACDGKQCGDDGCGAPCGTCPADQYCDAGAQCQLKCGDGQCLGNETCCTCVDDCGSCCGNGACDCGETIPTCPGDCVTPGFVKLDKCSFWMGSPEGCPGPVGYAGDCTSEPGRSSSETLHHVSLTQDFELQVTEVTQGEWKTAFSNWNPSYFPQCGADCPVEYVSWYDSLAYANWESEQAELTPCYVFSEVTCKQGGDPADGSQYEFCLDAIHGGIDSASVSLAGGATTPYGCEGYRLPTESEWEYAARAGSMTAFYSSDGNDGSITHSGKEPLDPNLDQIGWYGGNSEATYDGALSCSGWYAGSTTCGSQPVGGKEANGSGLQDMSGNVYDWCWDWYSTYPVGTVANPDEDPVGGEGTARVRRGGSWNYGAGLCRSANRNYSSPGARGNFLGVRLARSLLPDQCAPPCDAVLEECVEATTGGFVCAAKMVSIPAGSFWMGCNETLDPHCSCPGNECDYHEVTTGKYGIDTIEVTNAHYVEFLNEHGNSCDWNECVDVGEGEKQVDENGGVWSVIGDKNDYPMTEVTWFGAKAYCEWRCSGCRLCSEAEWEKAARGGCEFYGDCAAESLIWPWGNEFPSACDGTTAAYSGCNCSGGTCEVGTHADGKSPYGLHDMGGNVWEWVEDWSHSSYSGAPVDGSAWIVPSGTARVCRGAGFIYEGFTLRVSQRNVGDAFSGSTNGGVRCCRSD